MGNIFAVSFLLVLSAGAAMVLSAADRQDFKLQPGPSGEQCLKCHTELQEELKRSHLHPLVQSKQCTGCHQPHASDHPGLLNTSPTVLCRECHAEVMPAGAHSVHDIALQGQCTQCHEPHGSEFPKTVKKPGNELCFECHQEIAEEATQVRYVHRPVTTRSGCLNCHQPHASTEQPNLLRTAPPALCRTCHQTADATFRRRHQNYPVENTDCSLCHSPHGSDHPGIIQDTVHPPLVEKTCNTCHNPPGSARPLAVKQPGTALCRQCHRPWIDATLDKQRVHWPMMSDKGCSQCHSPHASREKGLLPAKAAVTCGKCHADTVELQKRSIDNPDFPNFCEPVKKGDCTVCHSPHSAERPLMFKSASSIEWCGECHEWQAHSSHPIGEKVIDPRNRNLATDCLSCHRGCGTSNYPNMLDFPTTYDLCVSCHVERRR
jgi:predicted CXXCH cytochrome family protein